jgi:hypothetical protein
MSNGRKPTPSLVASIRPGRTDRAILIDVANRVDEHTDLLKKIVDELSNVGQAARHADATCDELKGHIIRTESVSRQVSTHDAEQDAKLATIEQRVEVVETGWRLVGARIHAFFEDKRTKAIGRLIFIAAMGYAAARGYRILP